MVVEARCSLDREPIVRLAVLCLTVGALAWIGSARRAGAGELDLPRAARAALEHYPAPAVARARLEAAEAELSEAEARKRPTLSLGGTVTQFQEPMVVTPFHELDFSRLPEFDETLIQGQVALRHTLFDGGSRTAAIEQAGSRVGAARASVREHELALVAQVAGTYLQVQRLGSSLAAETSRVAAIEAERRRVVQLLEVGRVPEVELRRAEAALAAADAQRAALAAALDESERSLARLTGLPPAETRLERLTPVAPIAELAPPREELLAQALAGSATVERAAEQAAEAQAAVGLAESARRPELRLFGKELGYGSAAGEAVGEWNVGVELAVPIYLGGAAAARIQRAEAEERAAEGRVELERLGVEAELDRALAELAEASARAGSWRAAVSSLEEVARIEKLRLEAGVGIQTDYLDSEADLAGARTELAAAEQRSVQARVELARITGRLDLEWLERTLRPAGEGS
jgi:OMF family outer membrane factor